jgi:phosphoribosylaminoimidazolecarboxamide formyltransferase/IMP cyclohydrolase
MPTALLAAYTKDEKLLEFARDLREQGWDILASAGTAKFLNGSGSGFLAKDVAKIVGQPILGHRVVTLDRKIYAAILARPDVEEDMQELVRIGVPPIGLVYVSLYPLEEELQSPNRTFASVIEKTDIGGPTLLRAAAKGNCIVVSSPDQFSATLSFLRTPPSYPTLQQRFIAKLAGEAERVVEKYCRSSAEFYEQVALGTFRSAA